MSDVENTFIVVMHSSALGAGGEERAMHNQTRNLLRALDMNAKGARVFRFHNDAWEEVIYDSFGDDMGHHPGHDEPFTAEPVEPSIELQLPVATRLSMSDPRLQRMPVPTIEEEHPHPQRCLHPKEQRNITEHHEYCMRCGVEIR